MQFILAILAILLYAAAYAVGFIVVGIVELVKYIKNHKEKSREAKEQKEKRITSEKPIEEHTNDPLPVKTTIIPQIETDEITVSNEEPSYSPETSSEVYSDPIEDECHIDTSDNEENIVEVLLEESNVPIAEEIAISVESEQVIERPDSLISDLILALQKHLNKKESHTEEVENVIAIEETENNKVLLGSLIDALTKHQQGRSSDDIQTVENHRELLDLMSSLKANAELKRAGLISVLDALSAAKAEVDPIVDEGAPSATQHSEQEDIKKPHKSSSAKLHVKRDKKTDSISQNEEISEPKSSISELAIFNNVIYHVKLLGHEDPRFKLITIKAYEIISKYGDSSNFFMDIVCDTEGEDGFAMEVIRYIAAQKILNIPDNILIQSIRQKYIDKHKPSVSSTGNVFKAKPKSKADPLYIEVETSPGSRKLTAKSKIAHKHKAIQYANVIGGKLLDGYANSDEDSFHQFIKKHCKNIADRGDCSITTEEFEPYKNIITTYKKSKKKENPRTIATNTITPKRETCDSKANTVLRILDKLTSSRLPRYEIPSVPSTGSIVQREYKKTNPFDVYNDLVSSEYNPEALNDKRFAILYQLIMFISECVANGMSEEETLSAISSLRVVNKRDLNILRDREIRFKGLSKAERELVLDSELCNNRDMTNLYIDLIHHHKEANIDISLNDYIIGVLVKNYKESNAAWRLLKYICLKNDKKSNKYIVDNRWTIMENYFIEESGHGVKDMNETYYSLNDCFVRLKYEYDHYIDMTRYNFQRDNITPEMLNESTLKQFLPKRFDSKGRLCSLAMVSPLESDLFKSYDKRIVGDHIYVLFPVASLTTKDLYSLLLTVNKQKRKHI